MGLVRYDHDRAGMGRLLVSDEFRHMVADAAENGRGYAESISPRETGEYARSFRVDSSRRGTGFARDRAEARLVNVTEYAAAVEWRYGYRVLGRTVDWIEAHGP